MKEITRQLKKRGLRAPGGKVPTLCWFCQNAVPDKDGHGCNWSRRSIPVDGWRAQKSRVHSQSTDMGSVESYHVEECPEFLEDPVQDDRDRDEDLLDGDRLKEASPKKETLQEKKRRLSQGGHSWVSLIKF